MKLHQKMIGMLAMSLLTTVVTPAFAHVSAMHSVHGFEAGFAHPFMGLDHLLAMLAVGIWAAQQRGISLWLLPAVFPMAMAAGAMMGINGMPLPFVEPGIAVSVLVLGLLIASTAKLPMFMSIGLVSIFAIAHGYAHGIEMGARDAAIEFGAGFILATLLLHATGLIAALSANRHLNKAVNRIVGGSIAVVGMFFVSALV
ncbi:HupE/UreJ family protein [Undibacterium sp. TJN19]|uniref:HupE/UreJ family protein n=1 Tax=Undibacterium sp. TJN19 TaxID=3413055 RepID=UPI003BF16292